MSFKRYKFESKSSLIITEPSLGKQDLKSINYSNCGLKIISMTLKASSQI